MLLLIMIILLLLLSILWYNKTHGDLCHILSHDGSEYSDCQALGELLPSATALGNNLPLG